MGALNAVLGNGLLFHYINQSDILYTTNFQIATSLLRPCRWSGEWLLLCVPAVLGRQGRL